MQYVPLKKILSQVILVNDRELYKEHCVYYENKELANQPDITLLA